MNIYEYYLNQQKIKIWYDKFQSTSSTKSGKTFSYINTNFRFIRSFMVQFEKMLSKIGKDRKEWHDKLPCGQELDKHRIVNLTNAGFIKKEDSYYSITSKGVALKDLCDSELSDNEKWILLFFLLLDYRSVEKHFDIVRTTQDTFNKLNANGLSDEEINKNLIRLFHCDKREILFHEDIFWLISFANDSEFTNKFINSTNNDKEFLKEYVCRCLKDSDTLDLIAHKFKNSGAYSVSTFVDDAKMLFFSNLALTNINESFEDFCNKILDAYSIHFSYVNKDLITSFIKNHKSIYIKVKQNLIGGF